MKYILVYFLLAYYSAIRVIISKYFNNTEHVNDLNLSEKPK